MEEHQEKENAVKMQKLRRAVERLRRVRSTQEEPVVRKQSWMARLKNRILGWLGADVAERSA